MLKRRGVAPLKLGILPRDRDKPFVAARYLPTLRNRDLPENLTVPFDCEPYRGFLALSRPTGGLSTRPDLEFRRRKLNPPHQLAPLEKQRQLRHRQPVRSFRSRPRRREPCLVEPLRADAQPRAVPQQHLGPSTISRDERGRLRDSAFRIRPDATSPASPPNPFRKSTVRSGAQTATCRVVSIRACAGAQSHLKEFWRRLMLFLQEPSRPLDSNGSDRAFRGPVIGRRNFKGVRSR